MLPLIVGASYFQKYPKLLRTDQQTVIVSKTNDLK